MKKILMLASVPSMIGQFNMSNIEILKSLGYEVHVACNFRDRSVWTKERVEQFQEELEEKHISYFQADISRKASQFGMHIRAVRQVTRLCAENKYEFLHCHTPVGGVIGRIAGKKTKTKVIYTAHGFHFFKGASWKSWALFYPVEWACSWLTDVLITINREDYERAKKQFHARKTEYIPGVGVDTRKYRAVTITKEEKRKELGIGDNKFVLLSVGELADRKNHKVVIQALGKINDPDILYLIAGKGENKKYYEELIEKWGLQNQVFLLGVRNDIAELCVSADVFVHPSKREGLGIAPLEGMASGLPLISSYVNGIKDYTQEGKTGCCLQKPESVDDMVSAIDKMLKDASFRKKCAAYNIQMARQFDTKISRDRMRQIYCSMEGRASDAAIKK